MLHVAKIFLGGGGWSQNSPWVIRKIKWTTARTKDLEMKSTIEMVGIIIVITLIIIILF